MSFRSTFESDDVPTPKETGFFSMLGSRAIWHKGWKAVSVHPDDRRLGQLRPATAGSSTTPTRTRPRRHDLAAEHPEKLQELINLWFHEAGMYNGLPLEDRTAVEVLADPTRPQVAPPRDRYVYYPDAAEVPESAAVNIRNRSYTHRRRGRRRVRRTPAGVLFSHGARFGGHSLYVKDRKLKYVYNFVGINEQMVESTEEVPTGQVHPVGRLRARRATACRPPARCRCTSTTRRSARAEIMTQPGNFSLVGEGLNVGKDPGEPVTDDYPGTSPFAFTGGTIKQAIVDVSGEPFVDLEKEAIAMMARE